jgi:hypothetical protein
MRPAERYRATSMEGEGGGDTLYQRLNEGSEKQRVVKSGASGRGLIYSFGELAQYLCLPSNVMIGQPACAGLFLPSLSVGHTVPLRQTVCRASAGVFLAG